MTGAVVWFTGLPSSGKSTLAREVQRRLREQGATPCLLDGDAVRGLIAPRLGYSDEDRTAFYVALGGLSAELARQGLTVLVAATAPQREYRRRARKLAPSFIEVWVTTPLEECQGRDSKGLYAAATSKPGTLPGVGSAYEAPEHAEVLASGGQDDRAVEHVLSLLSALDRG
ncbi:MAG TPA: adenylyl-sulfate kinase [Polyangiaceae bacterium]|nr:adenylyl-sulfate kinase [Polyangiaceae bacterium]